MVQIQTLQDLELQEQKGDLQPETEDESKIGVIDDIIDMTKAYPKEINKLDAKILTFDKVFLCAGPLNSAIIIINSFDYPLNDVYLYDIPTKFFPLISTIPKLSIDKKTFGFSTASGGIILKTDNYLHLLFYILL